MLQVFIWRERRKPREYQSVSFRAETNIFAKSLKDWIRSFHGGDKLECSRLGYDATYVVYAYCRLGEI
jgi:hypothetical protein